MKNILNTFFKFISDKLFKINDSPHKIALGVGIGIFSGLLPGTGPLAALFLALVFKANRAAALIGSALTNTWLSFLTFILALKIGCGILNVNWQFVWQNIGNLVKNFSFADLFKTSFTEVILPVFCGYIIIGLSLGLFGYLVTLITLRRFSRENEKSFKNFKK